MWAVTKKSQNWLTLNRVRAAFFDFEVFCPTAASVGIIIVFNTDFSAFTFNS
jgi:hypothetical protein